LDSVFPVLKEMPQSENTHFGRNVPLKKLFMKFEMEKVIRFMGKA